MVLGLDVPNLNYPHINLMNGYSIGLEQLSKTFPLILCFVFCHHEQLTNSY